MLFFEKFQTQLLWGAQGMDIASKGPRNGNKKTINLCNSSIKLSTKIYANCRKAIFSISLSKSNAGSFAGFADFSFFP